MLGQVVACGKLVSGAIRSDSKVIVMPAGELATVRIIEWGSSRLNIAGAGDNIATGLQGIDPIHVMSGGVLWHPDYTVSTSFSLELKILVVDIAVPILPGLQVSKQKGTMHSISSFSTFRCERDLQDSSNVFDLLWYAKLGV